MTSPPPVSVLLPCRNAEETLRPALDSLLAQTFHHWQLVAVDDHSSDRTTEILEAYCRKDQRMRWMASPGTGVADAANFALTHIRTDWVARMDADDLCHPDRLEKQLDFLRGHPEVDVLATRVSHLSPTPSPGYQFYVDWTNRLLTHDEMFSQRFVDSPLANPSVMFRRSAFAEFGDYRAGDFPEDYELWLRWFEGGARFHKLAETLYTWRDHSARATRNHPRYRPEAFYGVKMPFLLRELNRVAPDRPLWIWGAGRVTRKRAHPLVAHSERFAGWIDVDPKKQGITRQGHPVISPAEIAADAFVVSMVGSRGAREKIRAFLEKKNFQEGRDYVLAG